MQKVNPSNYEHITPFPDGTDPKSDFVVRIIVETPRRTRHKFAFDPKCGLFKLKLTIPEGLAWPYDYGFVPGTRAADGDPIDILFLCDEPTFSGCLVEGRLLGIVREKKNGERNDRLVACAQRIDGISQSTDPYEKIGDVPKATIDSIVRFLTEYSEGSGHEIEIEGIDGRKKALAEIRKTMTAD